MIQANVNDNRLEVYLYFDIGENWDGTGTTADELATVLKAAEGVTDVDVHINSYGGTVSDGWAMYNLLRQSGKHVTSYCDGFACSAAVYPLLAGDTRYCSDVSAVYIHQAMGVAGGYAGDLRKTADELDTLTEIGVTAFTERTKLTREQVLDLMQEETWFSPEQCVENGICTDIMHSSDAAGPLQSAKRAIMQAVKKSPAEKKPKNKIKALWAEEV